MTPAPQAKRLSEERLNEECIAKANVSVSYAAGDESRTRKLREHFQPMLDTLAAAAAREEQGFKRGLEAAHEIADRWRANDLRNAEAMQVAGHEQADEALRRFDGLRTAIFDLTDALAALTTGETSIDADSTRG